MISFWQTDHLLSPRVQQFGCAVLDTLWLMPEEYTQEQVNDLWAAAQADGRIFPANHPKYANEIAGWAVWVGSLWAGGDPMHIENAHRPLAFVRITASRDYACQPGEKEIIKWWLSNVNENHFTVGEGTGHTVWDSMNRPDIMAKYATFIDKVILKTTS